MTRTRRPTVASAIVCITAVTVALAIGLAGGSAGAADAGLVDGPTALSGGPLDDGVVAQTNGSGQVRGSPVLDAYLSQPTVPTGGESTVTVDLLNSGEMRTGNDLDPRLTTARSLRVEADADGTPLAVTSGTIAVGDVPTGTPTSVPIEVAVPDDVADGEYDIEVTARYRYTSQIVPGFTNHNDRSTTDRFDVTVVVDDGARFAIVDADTNAQVGGSGDVSVTMANVGEATAHGAYVTGAATGSEVVVGDGQSDVFVGDLEPGENRTVTFDSTVSPDFAGDAYALQSTVQYRDGDGAEAESPASRTGITPIPTQEFPIDDVTGTLEVGYSGTVGGTITNDGPLDVDDAVLIAEPASERVQLGETRYALPELEAGESTEFAFDADVSGQADPGPRQIRFTVEYTSGDEPMTIDTTDRVEVTPRRAEFDVSAANPTIPAGESRSMTFEITNQRPETLSSINAGLYADSPLSVVDDSAFVPELEPGESTEIRFEVAAASDATIETHPVELDFRYDDERGNDRISDVIQYPVEVTEPETDDDGPSLMLVVVGVLVALAAAGGIVWYRRQ
ncbi:COG1361 S-layer family protein [Halorubrum sp. DTA98]|uniref:COG1361 S-layer family protein n=1 Tax=Halorubrum sp. DTA98 TaxID=3402163 RepID=UPI003AAEDF65